MGERRRAGDQAPCALRALDVAGHQRSAAAVTRLLDGDPNFDLGLGSIGRVDRETQTGAVANAWRHAQLHLMRQTAAAGPATHAARLCPHLAPPAAHRAGLGHLQRDGHLGPMVGFAWRQLDLGRLCRGCRIAVRTKEGCADPIHELPHRGEVEGDVVRERDDLAVGAHTVAVDPTDGVAIVRTAPTPVTEGVVGAAYVAETLASHLPVGTRL